MNSNTTALLSAAVFSLLVGFALLAISMKGDGQNFPILNPMSWLLIGLFPVFLIFAFFPTTTVSGTILGVSITGAGALFLVIWRFGIKWTREAYESKLQKNLAAAQARIGTLEADAREAALAKAENSRGAEDIPETKKILYPLKKKKGKSIGLVTGNVRNIDFVDLWVSSENTNMEMARHYDKGVSAAIRFLGSKRDGEGVVEDSVADELNALLIKRGFKVERKVKISGDPNSIEVKGKTPNVLPGTVLITGAGELQDSNNVKKILHVATVRGDPDGEGYHQVPKIETCLEKTLDEVKKLNAPEYKTILFPLFGTGVGAANVKETARKLIVAAISYLEGRDVSIETLYFIARSEPDRQRLQDILAEPDLADRVTAPKK